MNPANSPDEPTKAFVPGELGVDRANPFQAGPVGDHDDIVDAVLVTPATPPPAARPLSWSGILAWLVVFALTTFLVVQVALQQFVYVDLSTADATPMDLIQVQSQAKLAVGQRELGESLGVAQSESDIDTLLAAIETGIYEQRMVAAVLHNELKSPEDALAYLESVDALAEENDFEPTDNQQRLRSTCETLFTQYQNGDLDSSSLSQADQDFLKERLQWAGELALVPPESPRVELRREVVDAAKFSMLVMFGAFGAILLAVGLGFVVFIVMAIMFFTKKLGLQFSTTGTDHNIYIETFAIWMLLFFGLSIGLGLFINEPLWQLGMQLVVFFGSLSCLLWPVIRGVPFAQVRQDIGWNFGRPLGTIGSAGVSYLATLPLLIPGFIALVVMMSLITAAQAGGEFARPSTPGHPIQEFVSSGDPTAMVIIFAVACIAAPIVEETMFRGVLYRHLRDWTGRWHRVASVLLSASLNAFIFASIHPQGVMGVPVLFTLAIGFSFAREWRGSLAPAMVMHFAHNFLVTCFSFVVL